MSSSVDGGVSATRPPGEASPSGASASRAIDSGVALPVMNATYRFRAQTYGSLADADEGGLLLPTDTIVSHDTSVVQGGVEADAEDEGRYVQRVQSEAHVHAATDDLIWFSDSVMSAKARTCRKAVSAWNLTYVIPSCSKLRDLTYPRPNMLTQVGRPNIRMLGSNWNVVLRPNIYKSPKLQPNICKSQSSQT